MKRKNVPKWIMFCLTDSNVLLLFWNFLLGNFPITVEGREFYVTDLSFQEWLNIKRYPISIVHSYIEDWNDLIDYYVLINKGGTAHTLEEFQKALDCKEK